MKATLRGPRRDLLQVDAQLATARHQVVIGLQAQPETIADPPVAGEAQVGVGRHGALAEHDLVDPPWRHADGAGKRRLTEADGLQEFLHEDVARRGVREPLAGVSGSRRFRHLRSVRRSSGNRSAIADLS